VGTGFPKEIMLKQKEEHDPEKWVPVFRRRSCSNKKMERDDNSKKGHPAPDAAPAASIGGAAVFSYKTPFQEETPLNGRGLHDIAHFQSET
jgi:hypothetical protein